MAQLPDSSSSNQQEIEFQSIVDKLSKHPSVLKICKTVLSNLCKDINNPKFRSLNDTKLASKCSSDSYVYMSQYLKCIGFQRQMTKSTNCRWIYNAQNSENHQILLHKLLNTLKKQMSVNHQKSMNGNGMAYPPNMGDLALSNLELWSQSMRSNDNFHNRGQNWGNYYVTLIFVNLLHYSVSVHWINRAGKIRENGTVIHSGHSASIFAQLSHPHIVKRNGALIYNVHLSGKQTEWILGYNPTARGVSNNGCHVIYIGGRIHPNEIQQNALTFIQKAPKDDRTPPKMGPAPSPPRPEDRKGKFWGGR